MIRLRCFPRCVLPVLFAALFLAATGQLALAQAPGMSVPQPAEEANGAKDTAAELPPLRMPTLQDVQTWAREHGLSVLMILGVIVIIFWLASLLQGRIVRLLAGSGGDRSTSAERESRARTLVGVINNALRTAAIVIGAIMILKEFSVPIEPLLGGVAVIGLAVAFGAQSLIKDYFTGFMVLLEQQYVLGDVVKIGDITGQVENVTLRLTVLRDLEGKAHFIPHGQITTVTNLTHVWSRAVLDVGVGYGEDVERVIPVLMEIGAALRQDPKFGDSIVGDPEMFGVDALGDSAVVIKFGIKTRPSKQWEVKRELLKRIKKRFDELGIEIPFPQRTVWTRGEGRAGEGESGVRSQESGVSEPNPQSAIRKPQ